MARAGLQLRVAGKVAIHLGNESVLLVQMILLYAPTIAESPPPPSPPRPPPHVRLIWWLGFDSIAAILEAKGGVVHIDELALLHVLHRMHLHAGMVENCIVSCGKKRRLTRSVIKRDTHTHVFEG